MLKKTFQRIRRRLESLPKHHIDTSIFLESKDKEETRICEKYLQKVGYNYRGFVSLPVLSEFFVVMLRTEDINQRDFIFRLLNDTMKVRYIEVYYPKNIESLVMKLKEIDRNLDNLDAQILASAIEDRSDCLVTLDRNLLNNEKVKTEFKIKIKHPKELL